VAIAERSVTNLLDRYDELLATSLSDSRRLRMLLARQGRVILVALHRGYDRLLMTG
jgi:hypothetical protein